MPEVDRSFLRDLKNLDRRLDVKFNGEHMVVTYDRGHGEPVNIYHVKDDSTGGFRQPHQGDLKIIWQGDLARGEKPEMRVKKLAYYSEKMREKQRAEAKDNIRHMTRENKRYLSQQVTRLVNYGKGNSSVRRITPKRSKNTVMTIP